KIAADYDELDYGETRSAPRMPSREVYGRMDLSVASAHSSSEGKASAPIETPSPEPAPTPRRLPQTFRGSPPAPGTQINIDQVAKFIARAAIVVVVLGLVVWGIKSLVVGGHQQKPAAVVEPVAAQPLPEQTITLVALGPLDVQVKQEIDGKIIYRGTLAAGQRVPIVKRGAVFITYTSGRNLQVEINGRLYGMPTPGYDRARIE
ncbi:MAG: hypothetical protein KGJ37_01585, partial [Verrucomicrobiota bacterium]|nr:hypothetical protein [Verrucomicrobiota bacterium]